MDITRAKQNTKALLLRLIVKLKREKRIVTSVTSDLLMFQASPRDRSRSRSLAVTVVLRKSRVAREKRGDTTLLAKVN